MARRFHRARRAGDVRRGQGGDRQPLGANTSAVGPRDTLSMQRFHDKIAIVTGAGSGIGRATASRLAAEGAAVTIADIDEDSAGATVELVLADGGTARTQATNVADPDAVERMVADTVAA